MYTCNTLCKTNRCKCTKSGRLCNSKYHNSGVCVVMSNVK
ncbi:SCAN domain-containing protein 3-like [Aphis craccivora]|uniref:SCAN domain-containing protein 3-like n=1 Tax=Aphis craccivora TaxID=307492 RepID=A0A6G0YUC8_APHCR|nr:SCAN domain-containing protein 3-like [Aphis craccivora]